jgi:transposase
MTAGTAGLRLDIKADINAAINIAARAGLARHDITATRTVPAMT